MKTTSIGIENLCVPCYAHCRYCLLSSCGKATGVDYDRGKRLAKRLYAELKEKRPDLQLFHYIGYCMDDTNLLDYIRFSQEIDAPSARFLQLNGLRLRDEAETTDFMRELHAAGIESVDLTFYGTREYHDRFAGRVGDFDFLLELLRGANEVGIDVYASLPVTKENIRQTESLLKLLDGFHLSKTSVFLPHSKGRGRSLAALRLTADDYVGLSPRVSAQLSKYRTEAEFLRAPEFEQPQFRSLTLSLKPDNIGQLEAMSAEEIIACLEALDDGYYEKIPTVKELAARYGDRESKRLYRRFRDLHLEWQQRFLEESGSKVWDMNDETHHFSVRY